MKQNRHMLGIVFYEQSIAVTEVERDGQAVQVCRAAQLQLPEGFTLEKAEAAQPQIAAFLKEHGFKGRKAAVGISARNILSVLLKIPPVQDAQLQQETVKLHLERKLQVELSEIAFDYWRPQDSASDQILAMTTLKKKVTGVKALLAGLKITPLWLTDTSFGIDFVTEPGVHCNVVEYPRSVEIFIFNNGNLAALLTLAGDASVPLNAAAADTIVRQVNRTIWSISVPKDVEPQYSWWTYRPASAAVADDVKQVFGGFKRMAVNPDKSAAAGNLCDYAGRLAAAWLKIEKPPVNFLAAQHHENRRTMTRQWVGRIAAGTVVLLLLIGLYFYGWYADKAMAAEYQQQLDSMQENVLAAEQMIEQVGFARQWFIRQPTHLERLRELTLAFPQSSDIWLTSLAVDEGLNQIITGRATTEKAILDVVDRLKSNPLFEDIQLLYIRKMGQETEVMTFAINFQSRGDL